MDFLNLKMKSIRSQLQYLKSDYEYKQKMLEFNDKEFLKMLNEILEENEELKKLYFSKEDKKREEIINNIKKGGDSEGESNGELEESTDIEEPDDTDEKETTENETTEKLEDKETYIPPPESKESKKIKKLYRQIVKLTHPDKVQDKKLNALYLEGTEYYETNNLNGIYTICDILDIEYEIEESEIDFMKGKIMDFKKKINFLEGTFTWKWTTAPNDEIKKKVVIEFINMKLNT